MSVLLPRLITLGTIPVAIFATWFVLEVSASAEWPALWDAAPPLGALIAIAPTMPTTVEQLLSPAWSTSMTLIGTLTWLIVLAGVAQVSAWVLEDWQVPRPAGVPAIHERMPESLRRGFGLEQ